MIKDYAEDAYAEMSPDTMEALARELAPGVIERIKDANGNFECPICYDASENPTIFFPCGHDCCPECFAKITDSGVNEGASNAKCPECRAPLLPSKIIDYRSFKKVHQPSEDEEKDLDELLAVKGEEEEDSDSDDSDDESDDDANDQGDLRGFIVPDDEVEIGDGDAEVAPSDSRRSKGKGKAKASFMSGGKGKGKGKGKKTPKKNLAQLRKEGLRNAAAKQRYLKRLRKNWITSAKIDKTMEIIGGINANDQTEKIIIFSQFTTFLDLLEAKIDEERWGYRRYDGSMNATQRNDAVQVSVQCHTGNWQH